MKKVILFFSVLFLSTTLTFGQTATLSVPELGTQPAGSVFFPITIDMTSGDVWGTFQFFFTYDPAVLTPVGDWAASPAATGITYPNPNFPFYEWLNNNAYAPNEVILTWLSFTGTVVPVPGEVICILEFTYTGDPDFSPLAWNFTAKEPVQGWPEKGMTGVWTFAGVPYGLTTIDGSVGPIETGYTWNGSIDEDWDNPLNWTPNGVPTGTDEVFIPDVAKAPFPTIYGSAATGNLTIFPLAQLNVAPMADLTTLGLFTNGGTFVVESNGIVNPGQGEAGSYIDMGGIAPGGVFEFQRDITNVTPYGDQNGWHLISSPLPGGEFTSNDLYYYYLNWWDNTTQMYVHHEGSPTLPCTPAPMLGNNLMEGWSIKYDDQYGTLCAGGVEDEVINMIGTTFNTGLQTAGFGTGWDLLGNPYPNAIDPDLIPLWSPNLLTNTVYMWDGWSGGWVLGFVGAGNNIPPGQGFFVDGAAPGTFGFTGVERIHDPFQWWWKGSSDLLRLRATVQGADNYDDTYIRFIEGSTTGLDKEWDANKLFAGVTETPQIYTTTGGLELALNTQPEMQSVPMSFICKTAGTYTIEAIETGTFAHVVLEDGITGEQTDLLAGPYTFDYSSIDEVHHFIVHFSPLGIGDNFADMVNIWSSANTIYVQTPEVTGDIVVFNMMGQEVVRTDIEPGTTVIPMNDVNTYYVVKVLTSDNVATGKVFIK